MRMMMVSRMMMMMMIIMTLVSGGQRTQVGVSQWAVCSFCRPPIHGHRSQDCLSVITRIIIVITIIIIILYKFCRPTIHGHRSQDCLSVIIRIIIVITIIIIIIIIIISFADCLSNPWSTLSGFAFLQIDEDDHLYQCFNDHN